MFHQKTWKTKDFKWKAHKNVLLNLIRLFLHRTTHLHLQLQITLKRYLKFLLGQHIFLVSVLHVITIGNNSNGNNILYFLTGLTNINCSCTIGSFIAIVSWIKPIVQAIVERKSSSMEAQSVYRVCTCWRDYNDDLSKAQFINFKTRLKFWYSRTNCYTCHVITNWDR